MSKYPESMRSAIEETIREKIRTAGSALLREQGWEGFTTEKIAERVGLSRGVLYHYFANKEAIARFEEKVAYAIAHDFAPQREDSVPKT